MARKDCAKARFLPHLGHGLGQLDVQEMGTSPKSCKRAKKSPLSGWKAVILWLRGLDLNQRPPGYELRWVSPSAAAQRFPGLFRPEIAQNPKVVPLRSGAVLREMGQCLGRPLRSTRREITLPLRHIGHMVHLCSAKEYILPIIDNGDGLKIFQALQGRKVTNVITNQF